MQDTTAFYLIVLMAGCLAIIAGLIEKSYYNPGDDLIFCIRNMPEYNKTGERGDICYTKLWAEYCKYRAYQACPGYVPNTTEKIIYYFDINKSGLGGVHSSNISP